MIKMVSCKNEAIYIQMGGGNFYFNDILSSKGKGKLVFPLKSINFRLSDLNVY